jgi:hypothetical protein
VGAGFNTVTVVLAEPLLVKPSLPKAVTVMVCEPPLSAAVFNPYEKPTLGHPARPGKAAHTSARLTP